MKAHYEDKQKAIELRKLGHSYKEIMEKISVPKSNLVGWFKFLQLSEKEEQMLMQRAKDNIGRGRERASLSNRTRRIAREKHAQEEASRIFNQYRNEANFILGIGLYWAEGSKRTSEFQFMNSDPRMIKFMIHWAMKYLGVSKPNVSLRIQTHEDFKLDNYELFWSIQTGIPIEQFKKTIYKPNKHGKIKKNPEYKGCVRIETKGGIAMLRIMMELQNIMATELNMLYS